MPRCWARFAYSAEEIAAVALSLFQESRTSHDPETPSDDGRRHPRPRGHAADQGGLAASALSPRPFSTTGTAAARLIGVAKDMTDRKRPKKALRRPRRPPRPRARSWRPSALRRARPAGALRAVDGFSQSCLDRYARSWTSKARITSSACAASRRMGDSRSTTSSIPRIVPAARWRGGVDLTRLGARDRRGDARRPSRRGKARIRIAGD